MISSTKANPGMPQIQLKTYVAMGINASKSNPAICCRFASMPSIPVPISLRLSESSKCTGHALAVQTDIARFHNATLAELGNDVSLIPRINCSCLLIVNVDDAVLQDYGSILGGIDVEVESGSCKPLVKAFRTRLYFINSCCLLSATQSSANK